MKLTECPTCEKLDTLSPSTFSDLFACDTGNVHVNGLERFKCSSCGESVMIPEQIRRNEARICNSKALYRQNYLRAMAMTAGPRTV